MTEPVIVIPAYKPDEKLEKLTQSLLDAGWKLVIVDDGSGEAFKGIFARCAEMGADVLVHAVNMGKGRALKTAGNEVLLRFSDAAGVVTADCDGQHAPEDIARTAQAVKEHEGALIIGGRQFGKGVPLRSKLGNLITRYVYFLCVGLPVGDTQSGLRGISMKSLPDTLRLPGERYEWEMRLLMALRKLHIRPVTVPIETIYIDNNRASHFNTYRDAARVYKQIFLGRLRPFFGWALGLLLYALLFPIAAPVWADLASRALHMAISPPMRGMWMTSAIAAAFGCAATFALTVLLDTPPMWAKIVADIASLLLARAAQAFIEHKVK